MSVRIAIDARIRPGVGWPLWRPGISRLARRLIARQRERRALAEMDDRALRDIGINRLDAMREANKPFWTA